MAARRRQDWRRSRHPLPAHGLAVHLWARHVNERGARYDPRYVSEIQVASAHYDDWLHYHRKARWSSYWHQITEVLAVRPSTCLEIGIGAGFVRDALVKQGVAVTTVDIDQQLGVDRVGDVRSLPCGDGEFDVVLCSQVLEHVPWPDVPRGIAELRRVCRRHAIVSLPQSGFGFALTLGVSAGGYLAERGLSFRAPDPRRYRFDGQHYWQVSSRGKSRKTVRRTLSDGFFIDREFVVPDFQYHRFYVLRKRHDGGQQPA